jgi:DNA gyrase inhibitor GyrI
MTVKIGPNSNILRPTVQPTEKKHDTSALLAMGELSLKPKVSGDDMMKAILKGVGDQDGKAASSEFNTIQQWVNANGEKLSPEAKSVFDVYSSFAHQAQAQGKEGLSPGEMLKMQAQMSRALANGSGFNPGNTGIVPPNIHPRPRPDFDKSAAAALGKLDQTKGAISGDEMMEAIREGVQDPDGKGASSEFKMFSDWAKKNESRLSPEAKQVLGIYEKHAKAAQFSGQGGIPQADFKKMMSEMQGVQDASVASVLGELDAQAQKGPISGDQMAAAIDKGVNDLDGKAATDEFKQFADWAKKNESKLSPEAKEVLGIYEKYAKAAQSQGQSGIPVGDYKKMVAEMNAVKDASATAALSELDKAQGPITGDQMAAAIEKGVQDEDGKAASDEFKQFADWAKKNESRLSPEAKEVLAVYEKHAKQAQATGQAGIPVGDFKQMVAEMKAVKDASATAALAELDKTPGPVNGDQMAEAIEKGVGDLDGKGSTDEFKQFMDWAKQNESRLSPEAKEVLAVYEKYAKGAQATGQAGINVGDFQKMVAEMKNIKDASVASALGNLDNQAGPITGDQMADAINQGVSDFDGKAATDEFKQFADWAKQNQSKLSPEAKEVMAVYEKYAKAAQAKGQSGIELGDYKKMLAEMKDVKDVSAREALAGLDKTKGPINGDQMAEAIEKGVQDLDGKSATDEFKQFADWAKKNESRLSPEAKQVLAIYEKHAKQAQAKGQSGIELGDFKKMVAEMKAVKDFSTTAALAGLDKLKGPINGDQMAAAIKKGVQDLDGKGATDEFKQFADWAKKNESRLSPEAKEVMAVYEKYAKAAQAKGESGIDTRDFKKMVAEMNAVKDASATAALSELDKAKGPINGDQMAAAIEKGVQDEDGKAATDEFKQFADWAKKNQSRLSPEAKQVLGIYEKYAKGAQAKGQSGIEVGDFKKMVAEMKAVKDASATAALAQLDKAKGPINGDQMAAAIEKGVKDLDGKSASDEFKQFADWAKKNESRLSPEAKEVLAVYEKYAKQAQATGQAGINVGDFKKMVAEMKAVKDASATAVLAGLDKTKGPINGDQMAAAIEKGVQDEDGKAATDEFKQFADWAKKNESRLSPEAKEVLAVYEKYAKQAQAKGESGIPVADFKKMVGEMKGIQDAGVAKELAKLDKAKGPINGDQMAATIERATKDADGKAATDEFKQVMDWAKKNESRLSPEAKEALAVYEKYAKAAQAKGQSGIPQGEYKKMVAELKGIQDASVSKELAKLDGQRGPVSGERLTAAIERGTKDADNKAATDEFKQFADWAKKNESRLSPEAKKVMDIYNKYAKAAQAKGQSGIPDADYKKMLAEMKKASQPPAMSFNAYAVRD